MLEPEKFSTNIGGFLAVTKNLFEKYESHIIWKSDPESILDIGIGDGSLTKSIILPRIPKNIKEYIGGDLSENMVKAVRELIDIKEFKAIQFDVTVKSIPAELRSRFDHVFSNYLFHHVQNIR